MTDEDLDRPVDRVRPLIPHKTALIDWAVQTFHVKSIVDLGGCWAVHGGYLFHAVREHGLERGIIVDGAVTERTRDRAREFPQVELIESDLSSLEARSAVGKVDAAIMFDILLHQVKPDWNEFLTRWAKHARTLIIYNQQWRAPKTVRFIDELDVDEYIAQVPHKSADRVGDWYKLHGEFNAEQRKAWRDVHFFWQWGITDRDLIQTLWSLGYRVFHLSNFGPFQRKFPNFQLIGLVAHQDRRVVPQPSRTRRLVASATRPVRRAARAIRGASR